MIAGLEQKLTKVALEISNSRMGDIFSRVTPIEKVDYLQVRKSSPDAWYICNAPLQIALVDGAGRLVFFDARRESESFGAVQEIIGGAQKSMTVVIPSGIAIGWQALDAHCVLIMATSRDSELKRVYPLETTLIPFTW